MNLKKNISYLIVGNVICFLLVGMLLLIADEDEVGGLIWTSVLIVASLMVQIFVYKMNTEFFHVDFKERIDE